MSKPAIICVDDEPIVLESLKIELKQVLGDSCLIETAESGPEALELFEELQTDQYEVAVVLADQIMPGMRGDELLEQIHSLSPQTLNIMITGHADLDTLSEVLRTARLYRYIAKPWQSDDLRTTVLDAIQSYHYTRELEAENAELQQTVRQLEQSVRQLQQSKQKIRQQGRQQASLSRVFLSFAMQQVEISQTIQSQVEELVHLNQLKDEFLDSVSHELRAPISNIRMAAQMLEVRLQQLGIYETMLQCDRYFHILRTECQKEVDLLNDLLALTRLDSGTDPLNVSAINLNLWIPHVVEPFTERIQNREQRLEIDLVPALPTLTTDLSHLERILTELLTNAWKYTPAGETIIVTAQAVPIGLSSIQTEPGASPELGRLPESSPLPASADGRPQSEIWISVSNSGVEIPAEEQERIFDQFYRIPTHNAWHQGGTGLGLAIVKKRVEKLHGSISVASQSGQTTFTIKFPIDLSTINL